MCSITVVFVHVSSLTLRRCVNFDNSTCCWNNTLGRTCQNITMQLGTQNVGQLFACL